MPGLRLPLIDSIWRVRGTVPLNPAMTRDEVFTRLDPLLRTGETAIALDGDTLTYAKRNPAAQDGMATFTRGVLRIERAGAAAVLRFDLFSHALLLCFLAPLLFLGFAQVATAINAWEGPAAEDSTAAKAEDKPKPIPTLNPVDAFLGAPLPEDPNAKKEDEEEGPHSPGEGYFMAALFAAIYLVGRWLEPWLLRRRLLAALAGAPAAKSP